MNCQRVCLPLLSGLLFATSTAAKEIVLTQRLHHLRAGSEREWSSFPAQAEAASLSLRFPAQRNDSEWSLRLRQQDVKQTWKVLLNGKELGRLTADENDMVVYLPVPPGSLVSGENRLAIDQAGKTPDDIRVSEIVLDGRPQLKILSEGFVEAAVREADKPVPCRITIVNAQGALMTTGASSSKGLAVRPGVIYSADGTARFGLPAGEYTIHASRGFEYGLESVRVTVRPGNTIRKTLEIRREVPTEGYVSCDTHIHTLTHSGHGDCSLDERMVTLAGEGIELPIATDHNRQIDWSAAAARQGVRSYFTPVIGNEVTTSVGHFNIFPVSAEGRVPDFQLKDWKSVFASIAGRTDAKIVILNHPRDIHSKYRPFGPEHHLALTGENLDGWELRANAMEVINSGAQQTDMMRLFHDWFGLLNRGLVLTPVGASDSHDVSRFIVGQARTYIRCKDAEPGRLDVEEAVNSFLQGRVAVSLGLLTEITVNGKHGPGSLVPAPGEVKVAVRVLGPSWTTADRVELYANGQKIRESSIKEGQRAGVKWSGEWTLPHFRHDVHLVAIASGPGVSSPHWPIAKPYQPVSPVVVSRVVGATGPVWLDADGDGKRTSARGYAERLQRAAGADWKKLVQALGDCHESVAVQAASLLQARGVSVWEADALAAAKQAGAHVSRAFQSYAEAWRETQLAREK